MTRIDLVFRTVGERTSQLALDLALRHVQPDRVHLIEHVRPFSRAVEQMLSIDYAGDFVVFMDADCLILEDLRPFLDQNSSPYVDCYVLDKFRGRVHMGVHVTRRDVVGAMRKVMLGENELRTVLKPESYVRSIALEQLGLTKRFRRFKILHDFCQYYQHIFAKCALRELRSRDEHQRLKLDYCAAQWPADDLDYLVARRAVEYTRSTLPSAAPTAEVAAFVESLPTRATAELAQLGLVEKGPLSLDEVDDAARSQQEHLQPLTREHAKVFGIGLSRTGTKSLTMALYILGRNVVHYPDDEQTMADLAAGGSSFALLDHFDGITDITVAPFYPQLDRSYPNSKFILTVRDKAQWLDSLERHWQDRTAFDPRPGDETHMQIRRFLRAAVYGSYSFNRDRMAYVYDQHMQSVHSYFQNCPESLLVLDIAAGDGWQQLCAFLGCPLPPGSGAFPLVKKESLLKQVL